VAGAATTAVVLNRDDARLVALADSMMAPVTYFGVAPQLRSDFPTDEELYGVDEAARAAKRVPQATSVLLSMDLGEMSRLSLHIADETHEIALRAGGAHNAQNAAAAAALAMTFPLAPATVAAGLRAVEPAFGRGQTFTVEGRRLVLHLVKNPAGFRQTLRTVGAYDPDAVVIAINDDYADSRDVSWLWDVDFISALAGVRTGRPWLLTSGTRAADMALRLRYDEIDVDAMEPDLRGGVLRAVRHVQPGQTVIVLSTYTAMWALHAILVDVGEPVSLADPELAARVGDAPDASGAQR
jgi:UDP-N-acetylmuramyl tripeptide synthase